MVIPLAAGLADLFGITEEDVGGINRHAGICSLLEAGTASGRIERRSDANEGNEKGECNRNRCHCIVFQCLKKISHPFFLFAADCLQNSLHCIWPVGAGLYEFQ